MKKNAYINHIRMGDHIIVNKSLKKEMTQQQSLSKPKLKGQRSLKRVSVHPPQVTKPVFGQPIHGQPIHG